MKLVKLFLLICCFPLIICCDKSGTDTPNQKPNAIPSAYAGVNQVFRSPGANIILNGSGIDTDGYIVQYEWRQISGPSSEIKKPLASNTTIDLFDFGIYELELKVTDNSGAIGKDSLVFVVSSLLDPCRGCWDY